MHHPHTLKRSLKGGESCSFTALHSKSINELRKAQALFKQSDKFVRKQINLAAFEVQSPALRWSRDSAVEPISRNLAVRCVPQDGGWAYMCSLPAYVRIGWGRAGCKVLVSGRASDGVRVLCVHRIVGVVSNLAGSDLRDCRRARSFCETRPKFRRRRTSSRI